MRDLRAEVAAVRRMPQVDAREWVPLRVPVRGELAASRGGCEVSGAHERSGQGATNNWLTPRWIIDALGPFDLDPCASENDPLRCAPQGFTWRDNGLSQEWGGAFVFCNPPYGPHAGKWLARMAEHGNGIALVAARTETRPFNPALRSASCVLFVASRISFIEAKTMQKKDGNGAPSMLLAFGDEAARRLIASTIPGVRMAPILRVA